MQTPPAVFLISDANVKEVQSSLWGTVFLESAVISGTVGLASYESTHDNVLLAEEMVEGRFLALLRRGDKAFIFTDPLAQETLYFFASSERWAVSNSLLRLSDYLKETGQFRGLRLSAVSGLTIGNQSLWGGQPLGFKTVVEGVEILPAERMISVDVVGNHFSIKARPLPATRSSIDYETELERYIVNWRRRLVTFLKNGFPLNVDVSGGTDTRVNLALVYPLVGDPNLTFFSNSRKSDDFKIANLLKEMCSLPQWEWQVTDGRCSLDEAYARWLYGNAGVYLPVYAATGTGGNRKLRVHGGNFIATQYVTKRASDRARILKKWNLDDKRMDVVGDFLDSFLSMDVGVRNPRAMDQHYINFRSRFHYGRNWYKSLGTPVVTPLISYSLYEISKTLSEEEYRKGALAFDLINLCRPELLTVPFDTEAKTLSGGRTKKLHMPAEVHPGGCQPLGYFGPSANASDVQRSGDFNEKYFIRRLQEDYRAVHEVVRDWDGIPEAIFDKAEEQLRMPGLGNGKTAVSLVVGLGRIGEGTDLSTRPR